MLFAILYGKDAGASDAAATHFAEDARVREELAQLLPVLRRVNRILPEAHEVGPDVPLVLQGRYLGTELSAAFDQRDGKGRFRDYYSGVVATGGGRFDLLLVTLEKGAQKKEHLRYRDFPLNEWRFHWQSQARDVPESRQGRRYLDPEGSGVTPLLFVRERNDDRPGVTMAFRYLGPVTPATWEGERPITIEWKLRHRLPAELVASGRVAA